MYITANLPAMYGAFEKIKDDNYPFSRQFTRYIESIVELGEAENLEIEDLIGFIEDSLMGENERIPDIPKGKGIVSFRYSTSNELIQSYYRKQTLNNKDVTLLIIQMTLRLSVKFGTSLPRLRHQMANMNLDVQEKPSKIKITHKPVSVSRTPRVAVEPTPQTIAVPQAITVPEVSTPQVSIPALPEASPEKDAVVSRLERLAQKGASALGESDAVEFLIDKLAMTKTNDEFFDAMKRQQK